VAGLAVGQAGGHVTPALAIFVKTPGLSPVKTRLEASLGAHVATRFHELAAAATAAVVRQCQPLLIPYWAIAETDPAAEGVWPDFATLTQGEGDLGARLDRVYAYLQVRHGRVLLIGADAPQLTPALLRQALSALDNPATPFVIGNASDGGFWLFGGRAPIDRSVWLHVRYSQGDTARQLRTALSATGESIQLPALSDVDRATDLQLLLQALDALPELLPAQRTLRDWLRGVSVCSPEAYPS
jgi:uncharacterized protein